MSVISGRLTLSIGSKTLACCGPAALGTGPAVSRERAGCEHQQNSRSREAFRVRSWVPIASLWNAHQRQPLGRAGWRAAGQWRARNGLPNDRGEFCRALFGYSFFFSYYNSCPRACRTTPFNGSRIELWLPEAGYREIRHVSKSRAHFEKRIEIHSESQTLPIAQHRPATRSRRPGAFWRPRDASVKVQLNTRKKVLA